MALVKKYFPVVLVILLAFYIVTQPNDAAGAFRALGSGVAQIATGFGTFVSSLT